MAKAFDDETNQLLRRLAREVKRTRCDDKSARLAELIGVSPSYVSDFLNEKRGAGLEMLTGLGRLAPLEFLSMLGIDLGIVATLIEGREGTMGLDVKRMPDVIRRAARAVIELEGCTPGAAGEAAVAVWEEFGALPVTDIDFWFDKIRKLIHQSGKSGERPSTRLLKADNSR
jgi:hypothetical protein